MKVMVPMGRNPFDGISLNGDDAAVSEGVFEPFGCGEGTVRELTMERESDAETATDKVGAEKEAYHGP